MASTQEKAFCIFQYVQVCSRSFVNIIIRIHHNERQFTYDISSLKPKGASTREITNTSNTISAVNFK
jgi:hypothetical protein